MVGMTAMMRERSNGSDGLLEMTEKRMSIGVGMMMMQSRRCGRKE